MNVVILHTRGEGGLKKSDFIRTYLLNVPQPVSKPVLKAVSKLVSKLVLKPVVLIFSEPTQIYRYLRTRNMISVSGVGNQMLCISQAFFHLILLDSSPSKLKRFSKLRGFHPKIRIFI